MEEKIEKPLYKRILLNFIAKDSFFGACFNLANSTIGSGVLGNLKT
jgi:hypothetical protein